MQIIFAPEEGSPDLVPGAEPVFTAESETFGKIRKSFWPYLLGRYRFSNYGIGRHGNLGNIDFEIDLMPPSQAPPVYPIEWD